MQKFIFAFHGGGMPETPEAAERAMAEWGAWYGAMGAAVVDGGAPVGKSHTVHPEGKVTQDGGANPLSGFTIIEAETIEAACEMAKGCPIIGDGNGTVEVAPLMEM